MSSRDSLDGTNNNADVLLGGQTCCQHAGGSEQVCGGHHLMAPQSACQTTVLYTAQGMWFKVVSWNGDLNVSQLFIVYLQLLSSTDIFREYRSESDVTSTPREISIGSDG